MRNLGKLAAYSSLVALTFAAACSRPAPGAGSAGSQTDPRQVPSGGNQGESDSAAPESSGDPGDNSSDSGREIPFPDLHNPDSRTLPVGTLLTVSLSHAIPASAEAPQSFEAIVDEPVVVDGNTIIPAGIHATGLIGSTRKSVLSHDRGYVQLTLTGIEVEGQPLHPRTSSVFARVSTTPALSPVASNSISLNQGRRLTFRLTAPLSLSRPPKH